MRNPEAVLDVVPLGSRRKHEEVAHQIRELAISGRLLPGSRLPTERTLARRFNVSRTAIRDAFLLLETQGFLTIKRGRNGGAYLQEMHARQLANSFGDMLRLGQVSIEQLLDARLGIEPSLLDFVRVREGGRALADLEKNLAEAWQLSRSPDPAGRVELLRNLHDFHHLLAAATDNPVFVLAVSTIMAILQKYLDDVGHHTCVSVESVSEHQAILDAIRKGRLDDAREALAKHLLNDNRRTVALLRRKRAGHSGSTRPEPRAIARTRVSPAAKPRRRPQIA